LAAAPDGRAPARCTARSFSAGGRCAGRRRRSPVAFGVISAQGESRLLLHRRNAPKKSQVENCGRKRPRPRKTRLFNRITIQAGACSRQPGKARKSAVSSPAAAATVRSGKPVSVLHNVKKRRARGISGDVDSRGRRWHSARTGHAVTVAVGDGRGFSSLAAAPDGRAPAQCTARSWPAFGCHRTLERSRTSLAPNHRVPHGALRAPRRTVSRRAQPQFRSIPAQHDR